MTASLPEARRRALLEVRPDLVTVPGPPELEELRRYDLPLPPDEDHIWREVEAVLHAHGKVLWVRNQVEWANETYREARRRLAGIAVDVYHSRFRYKDRSRRHRRVIDRFQQSREGTLLVATQVAEMSLDLSADLLVTDMAPVPALIQRLGRLNRRADREKNPTSKPAFVCAARQNLPYDTNDLVLGAAWLEKLRALGKPLSQRDLADAFVSMSQSSGAGMVKQAERSSDFLGYVGETGVWRTAIGKTRSAGVTTSVVLERDVRAHLAATGRKEPARDWLRDHEVPLTIKDIMLGWERARGVLVAPTDSVVYDYDDTTHEGTGAKWQKS